VPSSPCVVAACRRRARHAAGEARWGGPTPQHPFHKFSVGTSRTLDFGPPPAMRGALRAFHAKHYRPERMRIIVAGPQPLEKMRECVPSAHAVGPCRRPVPSASTEKAHGSRVICARASLCGRTGQRAQTIAASLSMPPQRLAARSFRSCARPPRSALRMRGRYIAEIFDRRLPPRQLPPAPPGVPPPTFHPTVFVPPLPSYDGPAIRTPDQLGLR
jgi:hypothetical protein